MFYFNSNRNLRFPYTTITEECARTSSGVKTRYGYYGALEKLMDSFGKSNNTQLSRFIEYLHSHNEDYYDFDTSRYSAKDNENSNQQLNAEKMIDNGNAELSPEMARAVIEQYMSSLAYRFLRQNHYGYNSPELNVLRDGDDEDSRSTIAERAEVLDDEDMKSKVAAHLIPKFISAVWYYSELTGVDLFALVQDYREHAGIAFNNTQESNCYYDVRNAVFRLGFLLVTKGSGKWSIDNHDTALKHNYCDYSEVYNEFKYRSRSFSYSKNKNASDVTVYRNLNYLFLQIKDFLSTYDLIWDIDPIYAGLEQKLGVKYNYNPDMTFEKLESLGIKKTIDPEYVLSYDEIAKDIELCRKRMKMDLSELQLNNGIRISRITNDLFGGTPDARVSIGAINKCKYSKYVKESIMKYCPAYKQGSVISFDTKDGIAYVDGEVALLKIEENINAPKEYKRAILKTVNNDDDIYKMKCSASYLIVSSLGYCCAVLYGDFDNLEFGVLPQFF